MLKLGRDVRIDPTARIEVKDGRIGDRSVIGPNVTIEGRHIVIGREARINEYAHIGGGSCFDPDSDLETGDFLHMGKFSFMNQGRGISVGDEFGCGIGTRVYTHGAYESAWEGFPVQWGSVRMGDRVWIPNAQVNPGVTIGDDVVITSVSVVTKDIPSGCLAGGVPCEIIKEHAYPRRLSSNEKHALFSRIFHESVQILKSRSPDLSNSLKYEKHDGDVYVVEQTTFDLGERMIQGPVTPLTETLKSQLRRNGIRFKFFDKDGYYQRW